MRVGSHQHIALSLLYRNKMYEQIILIINLNLVEYTASLFAEVSPEDKKVIVEEIQDWAEIIRQVSHNK